MRSLIERTAGPCLTAIKDAGVSDEARILETLVLDICQVRRARVA